MILLKRSFSAYQPATVVVRPAAGSEPCSGRMAYPMVELVAMGLARRQTATSKSVVDEEYAVLYLMAETPTCVPPEAHC